MTNRVSSSDSLEKDYLLTESFEAEPAPTECVMIKEEPDSIDYDLSERNNLEDDFQDESTLDLGPSTSIPNIEPSMLHASFVPRTNLSTLKRKANDQPSYSSATTANLRNLVMPTVLLNSSPNKKKTKRKTIQSKTNLKNVNQQKDDDDDDDEHTLRISYLKIASANENQVKNMQMTLNKARMERERLELATLKEIHSLKIEKLKLEKEILTLKLQNTSVSVI